MHVPPEVEPRDHDFNVSEFLRSSPNPVVALGFGDSEKTRRAAARRGYPVMKSWFLNFGNDVHDQLVRERIMAAVQRNSTTIFGFGSSKPRKVAQSQLCHLSLSERAD